MTPSPQPVPVPELERAVMTWLKTNGLDGDTWFYTKDEWDERGETVGGGAAATLSSEGGLNQLASGHYSPSATERLLGEFEEILARLGYRYERGYSWSFHFYPLRKGAEGGRAQQSDAEVRCPGCGKGVEAKWNFCLQCGTNLKAARPEVKARCPGCGNEQNAKWNACLQCGTFIKKPASPLRANPGLRALGRFLGAR